MAHQFVKWWKTKFNNNGSSCVDKGTKNRTYAFRRSDYNRCSSICVNGYKSLSMLGSETTGSIVSDMEDLVHAHGIEDGDSEFGAHDNCGLVHTSSSSNSSSTCSDQDHREEESEKRNSNLKHDQANIPDGRCSVGQLFEDFECNVQVESTVGGEERKEFSFTFYDLDGQGKITKDDIAGLVRSIYGAVNDSITVPSGGKKTIKVKLSVAPDADKNLNNQNSVLNNNLITNKDRESDEAQVIDPPAPPSQCSPSSKNVPLKRNHNVNITIRETGAPPVPSNPSRVRRPKFHSVRLPPNPSCGHQQPARFYSPDRVGSGPELYSGASPMRHRQKWRESFSQSSANRKRHNQIDLKDATQSNFEKNNVQPCCHQRQSLCLPPNFSVDNHQVHGHLNNCIRSHCCPHTPNPPVSHNHHRSRSHDLSHNILKYHLMDPEAGKWVNNHLNNDIPPPGVPNSHHLKHKHREEDHARAMAQVIHWLEREHLSSTSPFKKINNHTHAHSRAHNPHHSHLVHEHQHIHHHFHHHYNSSKETPIIV